MQSEEEEEGLCEWFGVLRIPLKPGTASGYVGVQRNKSKASGAFPHLLASAGVPGRPGNIAAVLWDGARVTQYIIQIIHVLVLYLIRIINNTAS